MPDIEEDIKEVVREAVEETKDEKDPTDYMVPEHNHPRYDEEIATINGRLDTLSEMVVNQPAPVVIVEEVPAPEPPPEPLDEELDDVTPDELKDEKPEDTPEEKPEDRPEDKPEVKSEESKDVTSTPSGDTRKKGFFEKFWG